MAKSKVITLTPKLRESIGIVSVYVQGVFKGFGKRGSTDPIVANANVDLMLDSTFEFVWEYDTDGGNEFMHAKFTPEQLFTAAADAGLLRTTTSGMARVPRGLAQVQRLIASA